MQPILFQKTSRHSESSPHRSSPSPTKRTVTTRFVDSSEITGLIGSPPLASRGKSTWPAGGETASHHKSNHSGTSCDDDSSSDNATRRAKAKEKLKRSASSSSESSESSERSEAPKPNSGWVPPGPFVARGNATGALRRSSEGIQSLLELEQRWFEGRYHENDQAKACIDLYNEKYHELQALKRKGGLTDEAIRLHGNALATLLARAAGFSDENGWRPEFLAALGEAADFYNVPTKTTNGWTGALILLRGLAATGLNLATMARPEQIVLFRTIGFVVNTIYVALQSYVSLFGTTCGAASAQPKAVILQAFKGPFRLPNQSSTDYKDQDNADIPAPSLPRVKAELRLLEAATRAATPAGRTRDEALESLKQMRRKIATRRNRLQCNLDALNNIEKPDGAQILKRKALQPHIAFLDELYEFIDAAWDSHVGAAEGPKQLQDARACLDARSAQLLAELALGKEFVQLNVQWNIATAKAVRALTNLSIALTSMGKSIHNLRSELDGFDAAIFVADLLGLIEAVTQLASYPLMLRRAKHDLAGKALAQLNIISQTARGNISDPKDQTKVDPARLNRLMKGQIEMHLDTFLKPLRADLQVKLLALWGHLVDRDDPTSVVQRHDPVTGMQTGVSVTRSGLDLQKHFDRLMKEKGDIKYYILELANAARATPETRAKIWRIFDQVTALAAAIKLTEAKQIGELLRRSDLLPPATLKMLHDSIAYISSVQNGAPCPKSWAQSEKRLVDLAATAEKNEYWENNGQSFSKSGISYAGYFWGNGSIYLGKSCITAMSLCAEAATGFESTSASESIQAGGSAFGSVASVGSAAVGYRAYANTKEKNEQRARTKAASQPPIPWWALQKPGRHDFLVVPNISRMEGLISRFETLVSYPIDPTDLPEPYAYEVESTLRRDLVKQIGAAELLTRKGIRKMMGAMVRKPEELATDPVGQLGRLKVAHKAVAERLKKLAKGEISDEDDDSDSLEHESDLRSDSDVPRLEEVISSATEGTAENGTDVVVNLAEFRAETHAPTAGQSSNARSDTSSPSTSSNFSWRDRNTQRDDVVIDLEKVEGDDAGAGDESVST